MEIIHHQVHDDMQCFVEMGEYLFFDEDCTEFIDVEGMLSHVGSEEEERTP